MGDRVDFGGCCNIFGCNCKVGKKKYEGEGERGNAVEERLGQ